MQCRVVEVELRLNRSGAMLPWIGPALRGIVASRLKDRVCRQPTAERETRWVRCTGCPLMAGCPYGETFEPDAPAQADVLRGQEDATRPIVIAPYYPVPERVERGLDVPVRITSVGAAAARHVDEILAALADAGRSGVRYDSGPTAASIGLPSPIGLAAAGLPVAVRGPAKGHAGFATTVPRGGIGPDHVTYDLAASRRGPRTERELTTNDLPTHPDAVRGTLPRVGIGLTAPLFLTRRDERGRRQPVTRPAFSDLLRAALRTIGNLFALYDQPLPADFAALKAASEPVRLIEHCYEPFSQRKWSSRSGDRFELRGVAGGGVYADVPLSLVPWLVWGGRLHVGTHRVAGAGAWRVVLD